MWISRIFKLIIALGTFILILVSATFLFKNTYNKYTGNTNGTCLLVAPYKDINYKVFGRVFEPNLAVPVFTIDGIKKVEFLVDSGAVVSTIPKSIADQVYGGNYEALERTVLRGFGGSESFGYTGTMKIKLGKDYNIDVPVVFSESDTTRAILGRKGFMEDITTKLDHKGKSICFTN